MAGLIENIIQSFSLHVLVVLYMFQDECLNLTRISTYILAEFYIRFIHRLKLTRVFADWHRTQLFTFLSHTHTALFVQETKTTLRNEQNIILFAFIVCLLLQPSWLIILMQECRPALQCFSDSRDQYLSSKNYKTELNLAIHEFLSVQSHTGNTQHSSLHFLSACSIRDANFFELQTEIT